MSFTVERLPLSAITPIHVSYEFISTESLKTEQRVLNSGLKYQTHEAFKKCADGAFSQHTAIILTDLQDLKNIFETKLEEKNIATLASTFYLASDEKDYLDGDIFLKNNNGEFVIGGEGDLAVFTTMPLNKKLVRIKCNKKYLTVDQDYPFQLKLNETELQTDTYRQEFEIEVANKKLAIRTKTKQGYRYLSANFDRKLRFIGLQLAETRINNYFFTPTFLSPSTLLYNFDPTSKEVKYFNQKEITPLNKTVNVQKQQQADTSLLVSCSLKDITTKTNVPVNIAITKTNFATSGTYNTTL